MQLLLDPTEYWGAPILTRRLSRLFLLTFRLWRRTRARVAHKLFAPNIAHIFDLAPLDALRVIALAASMVVVTLFLVHTTPRRCHARG